MLLCRPDYSLDTGGWVGRLAINWIIELFALFSRTVVITVAALKLFNACCCCCCCCCCRRRCRRRRSIGSSVRIAPPAPREIPRQMPQLYTAAGISGTGNQAGGAGGGGIAAAAFPARSSAGQHGMATMVSANGSQALVSESSDGGVPVKTNGGGFMQGMMSAIRQIGGAKKVQPTHPPP